MMLSSEDSKSNGTNSNINSNLRNNKPSETLKNNGGCKQSNSAWLKNNLCESNIKLKRREEWQIWSGKILMHVPSMSEIS